MPRIIWKGAISFGLVNVPVVLKAAARDNALDFDWLDDRDMAPVGYQRINKRTGKPVDKDHIVKGYQYEKGEYVLMSTEDFRQANVEATQTVDIVSFVEADKIPPYYFETPYYLEPDRRGEKGYALLRETLRKTGRAALSLVVIHNRQHLAALLVVGDALVLNTMRWAEEVLPMDDLKLPKSGGKQDVSAREIDMAMRLVEDMQEDWKPEAYRDTYRDDLLKRIDNKIAAGQTHLLTPAESEGEEPRRSAEVIDMMSLLRESIKQRGGKRAAGREDKESASDDARNGAEEDEDAQAGGGQPARKTARKSSTRTATATASKRKSSTAASKTKSGRAASKKSGTSAKRSESTAHRKRA